MTNGITFRNLVEGGYVLTKQGADDKKAMIIVRDSNSNSKLDNNDGFTVSGPTSIFTAGEILSALDKQKYVASDNGKSGLPIVPAIDNGKIAVRNDQQYNFGSFVTALKTIKDKDAAVFASTEGAQAKAEKPTAPAAESAPASAAPAPANIDYSAIQNFQSKWANALSSLIGSSYCGDGSALNLLMPSFLNAMFAEGNGLFENMNLGGANIDYSAMPDGAGFSGTSAWPAIPAVDQSAAAADKSAAAAVPKKTPEEEVAAAEEAKKQAADEAFTKTKQMATQLGIKIESTDTNETLSVKIQTEKNRLAVVANNKDAAAIASTLYNSLDGIHKWNYKANITDQTQKINANNVIEVMQDWDKYYKNEGDGTYGNSLIEAINNKRPLFNVQFQRDALIPIKNALVERAKKAGLPEGDAEAFNTLVSKRLNSRITLDYQVEEQFEKMRKAIEAKETQTAK